MDEGLGVQSVEDFWGKFVLVLCMGLRGLVSCVWFSVEVLLGKGISVHATFLHQLPQHCRRKHF